MDIEREVNSIFEHLTREQFIQLLKDSGCGVREGTGKVIFTEELDIVLEKQFLISMKYEMNKSLSIVLDNDMNTFPLPAAC